MAAVYDAATGAPITEGLPGCKICGEAQIVARRIAARRNLFVLLSDDDGDWIVKPNGDCELLKLEELTKNAPGVEVEQDAADWDNTPGFHHQGRKVQWWKIISLAAARRARTKARRQQHQQVRVSTEREMTLGAKIRAARERLVPAMTQQELGDHFGITKAAISNWERGATEPELYRLPKLRSLLRVSFAWLLAGNGPPPLVDDSTVRFDDWLAVTYENQGESPATDSA